MRVIFLFLMAAGLAGLSRGSEMTAEGYALPQPGHQFSFPRDYGSHDDFKIEWWYITGHLFADDGRRFGFQATFFRMAGPQTNGVGPGNAAFGNQQLFLTHMALLDVASGTFLHQQRLNRNGWDAFAATNRLEVQNGNWSLRMIQLNPATMDLRGTVGGTSGFQLNLKAVQPLVVFGQNSVSRKAADPTATSYYLTFPRLEAAGQMTFQGETNHVRGEAWMDHEISSSQLGKDQVGWDWCCLQFNDGREIMAYRMRQRDGTQDPNSTLAWVSTNGVVKHLPSADFKMETVRTWKSPKTGVIYPVNMRLVTHEPDSKQPVIFTLEPLGNDQELSGEGSPAYWEGACRVRDAAGREVGSAYLELTGYSGSMAKMLE